jgi:hypothetical protein
MASVTFSHWRPSRPTKPRRFTAARSWARPILKATVVVAVPLLVAETGLRLLEVYYGRPLTTAAATARLPVGADFGGQTVNALGYADEEFVAAPTPGKTRIALLGGRATLAGDAATNLAAQLERSLPCVEVHHFGVPEGNLHRYAAQLRDDVLRFRPQFVLVCLSPADDVAATAESPSAYDVRLLRLTRHLAGGAQTDPQTLLERLTETVDYETYVRGRTGSIALCRGGGDSPSGRRWQAAQAGFMRLVETCREHETGIGVVLAPSEFQLNAALAEALRRRAGIEPERFDVELPQRRFTALADHLQLPSLDLLPTFRSASAVLYEPSSPDWNDAARSLAAETTARWLQTRLGDALAVNEAQ